ncbi:MAG: iron-containing alcohol dehydrogenase [Christensenellales bacterium]
MFQFGIRPRIHKYDSFREFAEDFGFEKTDVFIVNPFIYNNYVLPLVKDATVIHPKEFGSGEPTDEMIDAIKERLDKYDCKRIIAIGGGTIIDISKALSLGGDWKAVDLYEGKVVPQKARQLIAVPTTCGSGSEVTFSTVAELKSRNTKVALLNTEMSADRAILITEMVKTLPYKNFATSAIDALIHAFEAITSQKANSYSSLFAKEATRLILSGFMYIEKNGKESWQDYADSFQTASNYAGIAFSNASVGAVHALSYPLGAIYHIPHGESNQLLFTAIYRKYICKGHFEGIQALQTLMSTVLSVETKDVWDRLDALLDVIWKKKTLCEYGIEKVELQKFASSVHEKQQRLLGVSCYKFDYDDICDIYGSIF